MAAIGCGGVNRLYIVEIGGTRSDSLFEVHIVHVIVAADAPAMIAACRAAFAHQLGAAHIDGWVAIPVEPDDPAAPVAGETRSYLIEVGRNSAASLREEHDYRFIEAPDARVAIAQLRAELPGWHVDTVVDLDRLALERGWRLQRGQGAEGRREQVARYIRFDRI